MHKVLAEAIEIAGGAEAFAARLGISPRTLAEWRRYGVPDTRCVAVEIATEHRVSAEDLARERIGLLRGRGAPAQPERVA